MTYFAGIDNLLDTDPPINPGSHGTGNDVLFSPTGMTFFNRCSVTGLALGSKMSTSIR